MAPKRRPGRGRSLVGTTYWSRTMRPRILKRDRNICQLCGVVKLPRFLDVDHIMPRIAGGTDDPSNLRTLCRPCHKARRTGQPRPEPPRPTSRLPVIRGTMTKAS